MGKHIYSVNLRMEVESPTMADGESGAVLALAPESLYQIMTALRSEAMSDMEELGAAEFQSAMATAAEINSIVGQIEDLAGISAENDDDDDDFDDA